MKTPQNKFKKTLDGKNKFLYYTDDRKAAFLKIT